MTAKVVIADSATTPPLNITERSTAPSSPASGDIYMDDGTNTGSGNPGLRRYNGSSWEDTGAASGGSTLPVADTTTIVKGSADATKLLRFEVDGFTTGMTRVATFPDADITVAGIAATQTLTNKTINTASNTLTVAASDISSGTLLHERGGLEADVSAYGGYPLISGGSTSEVKCNFAASAAPTTTDDTGSGYVVGSQWFDTTNDKAYVCLDNTTSSAVWTEVTQSGGGLYTSLAILRDEKATTTAGGSSSATTWNARDLNTEVYDPDAIVTIASNQFTPISGDYELVANAPAYKGGGHRLRLYNVTGTASVDEGQNAQAGTGDTTGTTARLATKFTANGTDAYRIDHYTNSAQASTGLGTAASDGTNEIYLTIELRKLA